MTAAVIAAAAEQALASAPTQRTVPFSVDGQRYIVKRMAAQSRSLLQTLLTRWLVKRVTGRPLPYRSLALRDATTGVDFEARRLRTLAAAGMKVPRIVHATKGWFVMEHCGPDVATLLEGWNCDTWRHELTLIARDLGAFHDAGQWHGGAQIKNVTLQNGSFSRIDFEETFGELVHLSVAQAVDLVVFLNSVSLAGPIDEAEARDLLPMLLQNYVAVNKRYASDVRDVVGRALPLLARLTNFAKPFRKYSRKSIRRAEILVDVLRDFQRTA